MSHGSKKWIKDYSGRIKRSRNRTKIDYYAGLKAWEIPYYRSYLYGTVQTNEDFCPQCKHVQKAILNDMEGYLAAKKRAQEDWKRLYGDAHYVINGAKNPKNPWRTHMYFYDFFRKQTYYPGDLWNYDIRNYLCYKHERMYEQEQVMWRMPYNGRKARYGYTVREGSRHYRHKVKNIMDRAKYDEELYDDITPYKHEWLD
jgi:hypothetical protein